MRKYQVLIIGQGIAGSVLAHTFRKKNIAFQVVDTPELSASSRVAAGIWNPIVFKRMTKSWMADEAIPAMHDFFAEAENFLGTSLLRRIKILKFFTEKQEADLWQKKQGDLKNYLDNHIYLKDQFSLTGLIPPDYGFAFVEESGNVNTEKFIQKTRDWLIAQNSLYEKKFAFDSTCLHEGLYFFEGNMFEKTIFCEGWRFSLPSPFEAVQLKPAKGELLHFHAPQLTLNHILNKGIFILPNDQENYICGATYDWNELDENITSAKQTQLESQLKKLLNVPFSVKKRIAGIRPSVIDRRPVIGIHHTHPELGIFNGFGTKAILLSPFFSLEMYSHLFENKPIHPETNWKRFL